MWLLETSGCYCSPGSPRRRESVERGRAGEGESREQGFFYLCKSDTALKEKKKINVLNRVLEFWYFEKNFLVRTGWPNMLWPPCPIPLSPAENSLWIPLLCPLGVSLGIHDTKMAQPSCSVSGLYGVNYTDSRVRYPGIQPSPLCSYSALVLHYFLYYSSIYDVYWGLILLCDSWDGQVVSEQKNLKSK